MDHGVASPTPVMLLGPRPNNKSKSAFVKDSQVFLISFNI